MPRIAQNTAVELIHHGGFAFEHLKKAAPDVQQHPGKAAFCIGGTRLLQQSRNVFFLEIRRRQARVDAVGELRQVNLPWNIPGIGSSGVSLTYFTVFTKGGIGAPPWSLLNNRAVWFRHGKAPAPGLA